MLATKESSVASYALRRLGLWLAVLPSEYIGEAFHLAPLGPVETSADQMYECKACQATLMHKKHVQSHAVIAGV